MADSTSTIMGVDTIITEAEIGEVRLKPLKKVMLKATRGGNNTRKITKVYFSLGINNQANQNKRTTHTQKNETKGIDVLWHYIPQW
jgi:hypothetical protein